MGERILVTGAGGFIGSHVVQTLASRGAKVRALVRYNSAGSWGWLDRMPRECLEDVEVVIGDVRDQVSVRGAVEGCGRIINLAALIGIPYSYAAPEAYVETNVKGALNVLQAAKEIGVERLVQISTSEVYGTATFVPITEEHPLQAQSPYAATKIGADHLALSFHSAFGLPVTVIRPFNTYGPRQSARAVVPSIIAQIASGARTLRLGALHPTRDLSYVSDTVNGLVAALSAPSEAVLGKTINLGSNFEITVERLARTIIDLMEADVEIVTDERRLRPRASEVERLWSDNSKACRLLGWAPEYGGLHGLRHGLEQTIRWFQRPENLNGYRAERYST